MISNPILVVEHDPDLCQVICETLRHAGYVVEVAQTGREACHKLEGNRYSAAILAAQLSDSDPLELYQRFNSRQPALECILLTRGRSATRFRKGIYDGFLDVVGTPLNPNRLIASLKMI